jgi:hypothetical protein
MGRGQRLEYALQLWLYVAEVLSVVFVWVVVRDDGEVRGLDVLLVGAARHAEQSVVVVVFDTVNHCVERRQR